MLADQSLCFAADVGIFFLSFFAAYHHYIFYILSDVGDFQTPVVPKIQIFDFRA